MHSPLDFIRHQASGIRSAVQQCVARPFTATLTIFSIALALTLPGLLLSSLELLESNNISIEGERKINLFLAMDTAPESAMGLMNELTGNDKVQSLVQIDPDKALETLRKSANLGTSLDALPVNPLPITIVVTPATTLDTAAIEAFSNELGALPEVAQARLDSEYLVKLAQLGRFLRTLVLLVSVLFIALVCLVLMNNARLEILRRREEIEVTKLVGGTDGYVIRPFVYQALILCLIGSLLALTLISLIFSALSPTVNEFISGYQSNIGIGIGQKTRLYLPFITVAFAVTATWITVKTTLKNIIIQ